MNNIDNYEKFIENAKNWATAYLEGDHIVANSLYKKNEKLLSEFTSEIDLYKRKLFTTVDNKNRGVLYWTASGLIRLEIDVQKGISIIHDLANDDTEGTLKSIAILSERHLKKKYNLLE